MSNDTSIRIASETYEKMLKIKEKQGYPIKYIAKIAIELLLEDYGKSTSKSKRIRN